MPTPAERPDMAEVEMRAKLEPEVRAEVEAEVRGQYDNLDARDKAMRAFAVSMTVVLAIALPLVGLMAGAAVRAFLWASGLGR